MEMEELPSVDSIPLPYPTLPMMREEEMGGEERRREEIEKSEIHSNGWIDMRYNAWTSRSAVLTDGMVWYGMIWYRVAHGM